MTQPALVRHRSFLMAALLILGTCVALFVALPLLAGGEWASAGLCAPLLACLLKAFVVVRDYRG